jgi:hypothetical protein
VKINLIKTNDGSFVACDEESQAKMKKFKAGVVHSHDVKVNQNYRLHQKIFAFFGFCTNYDYRDSEASKCEYKLNRTRGKLTVAAGYFKQVFEPNGVNFEIVPVSLSFAKMPDDVRQKFYTRITQAAIDNIFHNCDDENIMNQLNSWF